MPIKYRELMKEYKIDLDNPVLSPAFVSKVNDFEEKLKSNQLSDQEIQVADDELVELFKTLHNLSDEDSEEVIAARRAEALANAKADVLSAETVDELKKLQGTFKDFPELLPIITAQITKIEKAAAAKGEEDQQKEVLKRERAIATGKAEILEAKFEDLQAMGEKYKDYPELIEIVNKRHAAEKPTKESEELKKKLLTKPQWSYAELKAMGVEPTGNDMKVAGLILEKEYLCAVYLVRK